MRTQRWIISLLAASGLTGALSYHWGQSTKRQAGIERKAAAERTLLAKQRSNPDSQQWDKIQKDITRWAALCADSTSDQQEKITNCMMRDVAQQEAVEWMQQMIHQQGNRPPDLTFPSERETRSR